MRTTRAIAAIVVGFGGLASGCGPKAVESTPYTPAPVEMTATGGGDVETATGAVAPGPGCADGQIVVTSGNKFRLIARPLKNAGAGPFEMPWPDPSPHGLAGWDNQLARLANGDLLLLHAGSTSVAINPQPAWWNDWFGQANPPAGARNGLRSAQLLWRASCGGPGTFALAGTLDAGTTSARDASGTPQMGYCAQGWPGAAGFDRPELYVDPWTSGGNQRVHVSTRCSRFDDDQMAVFTSPDAGATWPTAALRLPGWSAVAMTSTASGRLYLFQCNPTPTLFYSDDGGGSLASAQGWDVSFVDNAGVAAPCTWPAGSAIGASQPAVTPNAIARIGDDAVLLGYPSTENVDDGSGGTFAREVEKIVLVVGFPADQPRDPLILPLTTIRAAGARGSVLQAMFIEDDRAIAGARAAMLYWVETDDLPAGGQITMHARYLVFNGAFDFGPAKLLGSAAGWTETRTGAQGRGDYMKGGFFAEGAKMNFVATWPETNQVFARVITVSVPAPKPVTTAIPGATAAKPAPPAGPPLHACDDCAHVRVPITAPRDPAPR